MNGDHVRMIEPRERPAFPQQSLPSVLELEPSAGVLTQELDGHGTLELGVEGLEHDAHRATPQLLDEHVATREQIADRAGPLEALVTQHDGAQRFATRVAARQVVPNVRLSFER